MSAAPTVNHVVSLATLFAAKARVPTLPIGYMPRPERVAELQEASENYRLVEIIGAGLAGKTTLITEFARSLNPDSVVWYTVDEVDQTTRSLFEGLSLAVHGSIPSGNETYLLACIVEGMTGRANRAILVLDEVHRSPAAREVIGRLLRYLPAGVCLVMAGRQGGEAPAALRRWLEDHGQVATFGTDALRLSPEEHARFTAQTGEDRGPWSVSYRPAGRASLVAELRDEIIPALSQPLRELVNLLAVVPTCAMPILAHAAALSREELTNHLEMLARQTVLLDQVDTNLCRLSENARVAALSILDPEARRSALYAMGGALEVADPCSAALLFAREGDHARAVRAANAAPLAVWFRRESEARALEALIPRSFLSKAAPLALMLTGHKLDQKGAGCVHAAIRTIRPSRPEEMVERLRLLALCARSRRRPWAFSRSLAEVRRLGKTDNPDVTMEARCYALAVEGSLLLMTNDHKRAASAFRQTLRSLVLADQNDPLTVGTRLQSVHGLALAYKLMGKPDLAEPLYGEAYELARAAGKIEFLLETANSRAMLLNMLGRNNEGAAYLREALGHPWAAEVGIRPLLMASLADILAARDERTEAIRLLYKVLAEAPVHDPRVVTDHAYAMLGLLLAEEGQAPAAAAALLRAPVDHPAALIARAILPVRDGESPRRYLEEAAHTVRGSRPLAAHARAHLARLLAQEGEMTLARNIAAELTRKSPIPLAPWDEAILAQITRHAPRAANQRLPIPRPEHLMLRFFGGPTATVDDIVVGKDGWRYVEARTLFWYALAHGSRGFSRETLGADLFPELDGEQAGRALRNTFYALRQMFRKWGIPTAFPLSNGRGILLAKDLCPSHESDLDQLHAAIRTAGTKDALPASKLLSLLEQPYMADLQGDWLFPFRAYWNGEAIRALDLAATAAEHGGRPEEALLLLRREAEFSPDDPRVSRRILLLAHAMGDHGALRATYVEHCRISRDDLGVGPDPSVVALYGKLTRA
jgi:DNA-binding SARP family transcriptional activator/tetratricopeptide (TPR) repeat protein